MPAVLTDIEEIAQRFSCLCQTEARTHFYSPAPSPVEPFSFCQTCRRPRCTPQNTYKYGIRMEAIDANIPRSFSQYPSSLRSAQDADITFKIEEYIGEHYDSHLTLDEIASHVYLSRSYASSLFKEQTGCGIFEYLNAVRIDRACTMLRDTGLSLAEIAQRCGFEDQSYFTRVFKKAMRLSPMQYRKNPTPEEKSAANSRKKTK